MSGDTARLGETAATLRRTFDEAFAEAPIDMARAFEDLLTVRIGNDPFAVRFGDTAGLYADRKIVPVPSPVPELLGIVALRGQITPIYDLGALLGYRAGVNPRWFVLARGPKVVGLAFEVFEGHARLPQTPCTARDIESMRKHLRGAVQVEGSVRPVIHITSVVETIEQRVGPITPLNQR